MPLVVSRNHGIVKMNRRNRQNERSDSYEISIQ